LYYETVIIVNPDVSQENTQTLTDSLVECVEKASGRIIKREYWGSRPLAYQITKRNRGHYVLLVTDGEPAAVGALEHALRLEERVMRFLTTRLTELSEDPSPLMRRRTEPAKAEATAEAPAETKPAEKAEATETPKKAAEAPEEVKPAKAEAEDKDEEKPVEAAAEKKPAKAKATEKPAKAEAKKAPAKKAAPKKAEAEDAPAEKKKTTKSKKANGDADD